MADTVINQRNATNRISISDPSDIAYIIMLAKDLKSADTDNDNKVSKEELITFIKQGLVGEDLKQASDACKAHEYRDVDESLVFDLVQAANIAVKMHIVDEVTIPNIPDLCNEITAQRT